MGAWRSSLSGFVVGRGERREAEAGARRPWVRSTLMLERKKEGSRSWPSARVRLERGKEP